MTISDGKMLPSLNTDISGISLLQTESQKNDCQIVQPGILMIFLILILNHYDHDIQCKLSYILFSILSITCVAQMFI